MIIMREQLNVKQRQAISETPAKGGGGLVETCFSSLGRMVAFDHDAIMYWSLTLTNATRAILRGDEHELLMEEKVKKKR